MIFEKNSATNSIIVWVGAFRPQVSDEWVGYNINGLTHYAYSPHLSNVV